MRRIVSFGLIGLGVFAVALGLLLQGWAYPRLAKAPLDVNEVSVATGSGVTALVFVPQPSGVSLPEIRENLELTATRQVLGDLTQPEVVENGDVAAWVELLEVVDRDGNRIRATERLVCLDRRTSEGRDCTNQYVQTRVDQNNRPIKETGEPARQPGIHFKFPFDTEKRGYQMYDLTVRDVAEARFEGEEQIDGLDVYRFVQDVPPTSIETRTVPGSLVGSSEPTVEADLYYQNRRTVWVEPATGQIIRGSEEQLQELRPRNGAGDVTPVFSGTLTFNDETVAGNVADARESRSQLWLLTTFPIFLWIGGGLLIIVGIVLVLFWVGRDRRGGAHANQGPPPRRFAGASR